MRARVKTMAMAAALTLLVPAMPVLAADAPKAGDAQPSSLHRYQLTISGMT